MCDMHSNDQIINSNRYKSPRLLKQDNIHTTKNYKQTMLSESQMLSGINYNEN